MAASSISRIKACVFGVLFKQRGKFLMVYSRELKFALKCVAQILHFRKFSAVVVL